MLVLSRKKSERIVITVPPSGVAQTVEVLVIEIRGDKVRLGAHADRSVIIHRKEVQDAISNEGA